VAALRLALAPQAVPESVVQQGLLAAGLARVAPEQRVAQAPPALLGPAGPATAGPVAVQALPAPRADRASEPAVSRAPAATRPASA
jgi:hypothetical protein